ncbi:MAG: 4-(cytidine 5'-diphospho)-2-C-methyl-D-erythritol kinase [Sphingobacteriaceae bacterium]|nr:4-(cytidine 5'-diphospho)-2-C-methyl-D-erythritol kinase [Sphingobacteriaceae bacterium]
MLSFSNAKINLGLNIIDKRADGYHNLETIFYPIKIHDVIELIDSDILSCEISGISIPGSTDDNLCIKAYKLLQNDFNLPNQKIILLKNTPIGAGLGGGSANAAFLIKLINTKFNLDLSTEKMQNYARTLGSDCAFFIENKPVFAFNKGDEFEAIEIDLSKYHIVLVKPNLHVSTAQAYAHVSPKKPLNSLQELIKLPIEEWKNCIYNDFENSIFSQYPEIAAIKDYLYKSGAIFAQMSGSGSTVYAIFDFDIKLKELEEKNQVFYNV